MTTSMSRRVLLMSKQGKTKERTITTTKRPSTRAVEEVVGHTEADQTQEGRITAIRAVILGLVRLPQSLREIVVFVESMGTRK